MKNIVHWVLATILIICGMTMASCFSDTKKSAAVSATDDASQFVTITDVVPDVILEIRYFSTIWRLIRMATSIQYIIFFIFSMSNLRCTS